MTIHALFEIASHSLQSTLLNIPFMLRLHMLTTTLPKCHNDRDDRPVHGTPRMQNSSMHYPDCPYIRFNESQRVLRLRRPPSHITGRAHGIDVCDSAGVVAEATTSSETGDGPRGTYPPGCPAMALGPASLEAQGHGVPLKDTDLLWISPCCCCWRTYVHEYIPTSAFPQRLVWWINPLLYTRPLRPCHTP